GRLPCPPSECARAHVPFRRSARAPRLRVPADVVRATPEELRRRGRGRGPGERFRSPADRRRPGARIERGGAMAKTLRPTPTARRATRPAAPERCRRKFLRFFPGGFRDEKYVDWERGYK